MAEIIYEDVCLAFKGKKVADELSFHIAESDHACIQGPIGSGKTMLLRSLVGRVQIRSGTAAFFEHNIPVEQYEFFRRCHF